MKWEFLYLGFILCLVSSPDLSANESLSNKVFDNHSEIKSSYHPVHISYTNIEFNQKTNQFEILFKLFVDDFGLILNKKYGKNLDLLSNSQTKLYNETIDKYIMEHFKLTINGKDKTRSELKLERYETKEQAIWLYYNFSFKGNCNTFDIHNSLMTDLYQDQTNLLIFSYKNEQKALKFNSSDTNEKLTFE